MESDTSKAEALEEIKETMKLTEFFARNLGLSIVDEPPSTFLGKLKVSARFGVSAALCIAIVFAECMHMVHVLVKTPTVAKFAGGVFNTGYGLISVGKMWTLWYKQDVFRQLVMELQDLWPVRTDDEEANQIKEESLKKLRLCQIWYTMFNEAAAVFYLLTPIFMHLYHSTRGEPSALGFIWPADYFFDKHKPVTREITYAFEMVSGQSSICYMLSTDLVFTALTSHIIMLLRLLQLKLRRIGFTDEETPEKGRNVDCHEEIVACVKIHQRLMRYFNDLEEAFSFVNLVTSLLSSLDICCIIFVIALLEPWMELSNKFFLMALTTQIGLICWYGDDLSCASTGVGDAVFESGWYRTNVKCRRYLVRVLQRSQKPLYYTTMKFSNITLKTYSSTMTTAYSYFALLYTMYSSDGIEPDLDA